MRYAIRSLLKAREFTLVAVAIIAVGIGANTAVFSLVDAELLRPLPFRDASRLFMLTAVNTKRAITGSAFSYPALVEITARGSLLSGIAGITADQFNETGIDKPEQLRGARVSATFFDLLGVPMSVGRAFAASDDAPGSPAVVIVGRRYRARRFNDSAGAIGATLMLNGAPHTVVGALGIDLPPPFDDVDVWATHVEELSGFSRAQIDAGLGYLSAVVRVPGGTPVD
jgi:putative ABC transport system permease protein